MLPALIGPLLAGLLKVIDKSVEDETQAAAIKARLNAMALDGSFKELEAAASIVVAEAQGESWLQRNWRPLLMVLFGAIVANNYVLVPLFGTPAADIPPDMWDLLKLGVGGYVMGRSAEKGIKAWRQ